MSKYLKFKYYFVFTFVLIVLIVIHPTKETMICNQDFHCEVKHEFCNLFKLTSKFDINAMTELDAFTLHVARSLCNTYITLDKKNLFVMGAFASYPSNESYYLNRESIKFEKYKRGEIKEYRIDGIANQSYTYMWIFIYLLFGIPILNALIRRK